MLPELTDIEVERIHADKAVDKKKKRTVNVDMNPMVDLAFLLLTFFMLATTFSKPQAMELLIPAKPDENSQEKEIPVKESKTISLVLAIDSVHWYRGITDPEPAHMTYKELEAMLEEMNSKIDKMVVLIKPLEESNYGNLVTTIDALNFAEVQRFALSPLSEFDESFGSKSEAKE